MKRTYPHDVEYVCQMCGSDQVDVSKEFDHVCSNKPTLSCYCTACDFGWYDDREEEC